MKGKRIIITSDRSIFSTHPGMQMFYFGFVSALPTRLIPNFLQHRIFCPPPPSNLDGTAKYTILALRCVESSFIESGIPENDIAVVHPNKIHKFIGNRTEFVCVSAHDPLGKGSVTTTWSSMIGGSTFNCVEFERLLMRDISQFKKKYDFKLVVGGPGSWQLSSERLLSRFKISYLAIGEAETLVPKIIDMPKQRIITAPPPGQNDVPPIRRPTAGGLIEITRGCGLGCAFCTPTLSGRLRSFPKKKIFADVNVNILKGKSKTIILHSDNTLNYGSKTSIPDEDVIMELYKSIFRINGVKRVYLTFNNLAPFAYMPHFIEKLTKFLRKHGHRYYLFQTGIETASPRLMREFMPNKCLPYTPDEWPKVVRKAFNVANENQWVSLATIIIGLPGEEREDILQTIELVKSLDNYNTIYFVPIFFAPIDITRIGNREGFNTNKMTDEHWRLMVLCWRHNLRIVGKLYNIVSSDLHDLFSKTIIRLGLQMARLVIPLKFSRYHLYD